MKSAISLALSMRLVASAFPVAAQDGIAATPGPIARAITREAVRLGTVQEVAKPGDSDWASVRRLAPGTEVIVTVRGSRSGKRHVVSASDSVLTVLNLAQPLLHVLPQVRVGGQLRHLRALGLPLGVPLRR